MDQWERTALQAACNYLEKRLPYLSPTAVEHISLASLVRGLRYGPSGATDAAVIDTYRTSVVESARKGDRHAAAGLEAAFRQLIEAGEQVPQPIAHYCLTPKDERPELNRRLNGVFWSYRDSHVARAVELVLESLPPDAREDRDRWACGVVRHALASLGIHISFDTVRGAWKRMKAIRKAERVAS
ncbi:protein of unknown function [Hyphomicrobium sp. 1Nfss2.1]